MNRLIQLAPQLDKKCEKSVIKTPIPATGIVSTLRRLSREYQAYDDVRKINQQPIHHVASVKQLLWLGFGQTTLADAAWVKRKSKLAKIFDRS